VPSYWIAHPTDMAFISALSPEGVGQLLIMAERWPIGRYLIGKHHHGRSPAGPEEDQLWGYAIKDGEGRVWIETSSRRRWATD
jgi:hypothetical protein